jgi:hypothetical protein
MEAFRSAWIDVLSGESVAWESRCMVGFSSMVVEVQTPVFEG